MITKIAELLGKELSVQVTEKLGDLELGIVNDGTLVPAGKHDTLKADHKTLQDKYKDDMAGVQKQLTELGKTGQTVDELKTAIEDLKTERQEQTDKHDTEMKQLQINNALEITLAGSGIKKGANSLKAVKAVIDLKEAVLKDGKILGLEEQITKLKETDSYLFDTTKKKGNDPTGGITPPTGDKAKLIEEYNKAKPMDRLAIMDKINALG